ncbi:hypothetical protein Tco_0521011, partial [Tanacetum coccineum]
ISTADNIILDPDVLELGNSISLTEAAEEEAARQVHATHVRIVTESEPEPAKKKTGSLSTRGVVIQDMPKQEAAYTMQALKESKKTNRRQPSTGGSNEGTGVSLGVPDESIIIPATSSEGTGTKPGVLDEEKVTSEEKVIFKWGSEQESEYSEEDQGSDEEVDWIDSDEDEEKKDDDDDDKSIDLENTNDEETYDEFVHSDEYVQTDDKDTDDEFVQSDEQVNDDEDEEMTNVEDADTRNVDEEMTDTAKADAEKTEDVKDDINKTELPPSSSSLSVSLGFDNQFI